MKRHRNFKNIAIAAIAFSLVTIPSSSASANAVYEKTATESGIVSSSVSRYQQILPGKFKVYLKDGSVWEGEGMVRKSHRPKADKTMAATLTPKGRIWILELEGSKRKYRVKRLK